MTKPFVTCSLGKHMAAIKVLALFDAARVKETNLKLK